MNDAETIESSKFNDDKRLLKHILFWAKRKKSVCVRKETLLKEEEKGRN